MHRHIRNTVRWLLHGLLLLVLAIGMVAVLNASFWSGYRGTLTLLAHRGVQQTLHGTIDIHTCTAAIDPPEHAFLENTIASMRAAFAAGADIVELDIHATTDGQLAVFHDW